jgi:hypothetical protein
MTIYDVSALSLDAVFVRLCHARLPLPMGFTRTLIAQVASNTTSSCVIPGTACAVMRHVAIQAKLFYFDPQYMSRANKIEYSG